MSAEVLREASARIRHDVEFDQAHGDPAFLLAVADLLDTQARNFRHLAGLSGCIERNNARPPNATGECPACRTLTVARAYLGGAA